MIPRNTVSGPIGGKTSLCARIYPNGEAVVWKARTTKMEPMVPPHEFDEAGLFCACMRAYGTVAPALWAGLVPLGSSPHTNSDELQKAVVPGLDGVEHVKLRYGKRGITTYGARRVRNACYLIEAGLPKMCTVFSTCTVPTLPFESMRLIHERWSDVVEHFRRKLRRRLQEQGLSGDSVTVSEIQEKRYERTGLPILHIHTVFGGRRRDGKPAISPEAHDAMWREALSLALGDDVGEVRSACNLQWVKKSAEGYLGKYMTKGTKVVNRLIEEGFDGWLPKQWWSVSRALGKEIDNQTRRVDELAEWFNDIAEVEGANVWIFHRDVEIEMFNGDKVKMARYGRLTQSFMKDFRRANMVPNNLARVT